MPIPPPGQLNRNYIASGREMSISVSKARVSAPFMSKTLIVCYNAMRHKQLAMAAPIRHLPQANCEEVNMSKVFNPKAWYLVGIGAAALAVDGLRRLVKRRREEAESAPVANEPPDEHIPFF